MFIIQCSSQNSTKTRIVMSPSKAYTYSVKVMNPRKKTAYTVRRLEETKKFYTIQGVKEELLKCLQVNPEDIGYVSPGHGLKGKQNPLNGNEDLSGMYTAYKKKRDIMLCCNAVLPENTVEEKNPRKRQHSEDGNENGQLKRGPKVADVKEIVDKLKEKHGSKFTPERLMPGVT